VIALLAGMAAVLAADGWVPERDANGCVLESRPASHPDGAAMRATCDWPEVQPEKLVALLGDFDRYDELIYPIVEAHVVRRDPDRVLVYQRHHFFGIADREMLLWMRTVSRDGGTSFEWDAASEEPLEVQPGLVRPARNSGRWFIAPDGSGGSKVVHEVTLDPGGSVPEWVIDLAGSRGFVRILNDVRARGGKV
jgi:hypothetical protein